MHLPPVGLLAPICGGDTAQVCAHNLDICPECAVDMNAGTKSSPNMG